MSKKIVVSACLAGIECRYDCKSNTVTEIKKLVEENNAIAICPEQLGGLSTPRPPAEQIKNKVLTIEGKDVTLEYMQGAKIALDEAKNFGATEAILKSKSPMCGVGKIYDGTFSRTLKDGNGIFTELLIKNGFKVRTED